MFRIYQGDSVVAEGESPLAITGIAPNTSVPAGEYQATRVEGVRESERVDIPAFTTLPIAVTGVSVSPQTSTAEAGTAGNRRLTVTVEPENATNKNVTYEITPTAQGLSVSDSGIVTWTEETPANVYVTEIKTEDGNHIATHTLTLTEPEPEGIIIPRGLEMLKGTTEQLTARETVRWLSANESVISVDNNGVVTANEEGVAEVIATTTDGREDEITVVVLENPDSTVDPEDRVGPTSITLDPSEHTFSELGVNKLIKIHIEPTNAETDVEWTTSDESIVDFNPSLGGKGWIRARGVGTATITARSTVNGVEGIATIHVVNG